MSHTTYSNSQIAPLYTLTYGNGVTMDTIESQIKLGPFLNPALAAALDELLACWTERSCTQDEMDDLIDDVVGMYAELKSS